jgi:hypothetical protein
MANEADKTRKAFEVWAKQFGYDLTRCDASYVNEPYQNGYTDWAWLAWQASVSSHASEVKRLREALEGVLAVVERPQNFRIWAADLLTCSYTAPAFDNARAALQGDK